MLTSGAHRHLERTERLTNPSVAVYRLAIRSQCGPDVHNMNMMRHGAAVVNPKGGRRCHSVTSSEVNQLGAIDQLNEVVIRLSPATSTRLCLTRGNEEEDAP